MYKREIDSALSFLDVTVEKENSKFNTSMYQKNIFIGQDMNDLSNICHHYKSAALFILSYHPISHYFIKSVKLYVIYFPFKRLFSKQ